MTKAFKKLTKSAQATGEDDEMGEDELDEMVRSAIPCIIVSIAYPSQLAKAKAEQDKQYAEKVKENQAARAKVCSLPCSVLLDSIQSQAKGKGKAAPSVESDDSMMVDEPVGGGGSDFDDDSEPVAPKKKTVAAAKKAPAKAPAKAKAAPKKAPAKRGKKVVVRFYPSFSTIQSTK